MIDTFKARLKAKTKAAGVNLSQKRIDAFADRLHKKNPDVKEEKEHDDLIDALDELVVFADVAKEDDQIRTKDAQIKKLSEKKPDSKKPEDSDEEEEEEEEEEEPKGKKKSKQEKEKPGRMPKYLQEMAAKLDMLLGEKSKATIKSLIAAKLKGEDGQPKVPEKFYSRWNLPEKEEDIDTFVAEVEAEYTELIPAGDAGGEKETKQQPVNGGHKPNRGGKTTSTASEKEIDEVMSRMNPQYVKTAK